MLCCFFWKLRKKCSVCLLLVWARGGFGAHHACSHPNMSCDQTHCWESSLLRGTKKIFFNETLFLGNEDVPWRVSQLPTQVLTLSVSACTHKANTASQHHYETKMQCLHFEEQEFRLKELLCWPQSHKTVALMSGTHQWCCTSILPFTNDGDLCSSF